MKTTLAIFSALLLLSACAAGKPAPQNPAPVPESPDGRYLARTAASAELHIVSPDGRISIDNLEIGNGKQPLIAQADNPAPVQCPLPPSPPAPAPTAGRRKAWPTPANSVGDDVADKAVELAERTDAVPAEEPHQKGKLPGRLPE
jgi:hypothetical protein